ncbi:hypothetical protein C5167_003266 [Papaver somniferum]|nr:hypothetical protein C5167_003266 [Papaver somniferum]
MKDPTGNWISQPPSHEPIVAEDGTVHNLDEYICIPSSSEFEDKSAAIQRHKLGVVVTEENFEGFFSLV